MTEVQKTVSVIGLGYIGLPTAAVLASRGYQVKGFDTNQQVLETISHGDIHIVEPGLDVCVRDAVGSRSLRVYSEVQAADIYIICVPTPFHVDSEIPEPNIEHVVAATKSLSPHIKAGDIVILELTSPVGTTELVENTLRENGIDTSVISIAYCPERVLPGKVMEELVENSRVVGGITTEATAVVANFYKTFVRGTILETNAKTAEMCKLVENSYRDVNLAFANELSVLCDNNGVDVWNLIQLANHHPRVNILQPGAGVGGHCIAVDPWFIVSSDPENARLIRAAREVNNSKPNWVVDKIKAAAFIKQTLKIACLGLAFKPDIDDLRESPAIMVVTELVNQGYEVSCVEPNIANHAEFRLISLDDAIAEFDVIALLVNHKEFSVSGVVDQLRIKGGLDFCGAMSD